MDESTGRNYSTEMSIRVTRLLAEADSDIIPAVAAWNLVDDLKKTDPDLLTGWLLEHSRTFVAEQIKHRLSSSRARARTNASRSAFASAARAFVGGDTDAISPWTVVRYAVDGDNTQRRLLDMNRADLTYAASRYGRTAQSALLEEAFLRALAARVGEHSTVGDVCTEIELDKMYSSIQSRTNVEAS